MHSESFSPDSLASDFINSLDLFELNGDQTKDFCRKPCIHFTWSKIDTTNESKCVKAGGKIISSFTEADSSCKQWESEILDPNGDFGQSIMINYQTLHKRRFCKSSMQPVFIDGQLYCYLIRKVSAETNHLNLVAEYPFWNKNELKCLDNTLKKKTEKFNSCVAYFTLSKTL